MEKVKKTVSHLAKFTPAKVRQIRRLASEMGQVALADKFKCSQKTISNIITGKTYKSV